MVEQAGPQYVYCNGEYYDGEIVCHLMMKRGRAWGYAVDTTIPLILFH